MEEYQDQDLDSDLRKRIRIIEETLLLTEKLQEHFAAQTPTVAEQVHLEGILAETKDGAEEIASRLNGGEDFASLAQELSQDNSSKEQGGDLGWLPQGVMGLEFDEAAFSLEPGVLSQPIPDERGQTEEGHWVIRVLEKDEARSIDEDTHTKIAANELNRWFEGVKQDSLVEDYLDEDKKLWAVKEMGGF
jgi:foldase protein PrsA